MTFAWVHSKFAVKIVVKFMYGAGYTQKNGFRIYFETEIAKIVTNNNNKKGK